MMIENTIKQIIINDRLIGLIGSDDAVRNITAECQSHADNEIQIKLLDLISSNNYRPVNAPNACGKAIFRELKKAQGLPLEPATLSGLTIAALGMGCTRCNQLESDIRDILSELKTTADLRHITDLRKIARYGVMDSPALVANNKVLSVGEVPPKTKIRQWIIEPQTPHDNIDK
jgi:hypothetical protein